MANTIQSVVDFFRESLREISDDSVYTDQFLYQVLSHSRSELISQSLSNNKSLSPWVYQRFCVKLCPSNFIECTCQVMDFGCSVYRSVNPIPEFVFDDSNLILSVSELWGDHINQVTERSNRVASYRKYKKPFNYYIGDYEGGKYLFILGEKIPPKYIKLEGVVEDPMMVTQLACTDGCPAPQGIGFPLSNQKHSALFKMAFEYLGAIKNQFEDRSNNASSTVNEKQI